MGKSRIARGRLMLGASAVGSALAGYGRAFAQSCTLDTDHYTCSGATTTTQNITLGGSVTSITTTPGFSMNAASGRGFFIQGTGSFIDTNHSTISGPDDGIFFSASAADAKITITSNGLISGTSAYGNGIETHSYGSGGQTLTLNDVSGGSDGIYSRIGSAAGDTLITSTGTISGVRDGIAISPNGAGNTTLDLNNVTGGNRAISLFSGGTGNMTVTTTGLVNQTNDTGDGAIFTEATGGGGITLNVADVTGTGAGIVTEQYGTGSVAINVSGTIAAHNSAANAVGILSRSQATGGNTSIVIAKGASVEGDAGAINARPRNGDLTINNAGSLTLTGQVGRFAGGHAALDAELQGNGNITITSSGVITDKSLTHWGIYGFHGSNYSSVTGDMKVDITGSVSGGGGVYLRNQGASQLFLTIDSTITGGQSIDPDFKAEGVRIFDGGTKGQAQIVFTKNAVINGGVAFNPEELGLGVPDPGAVLSNAGTINGGIYKYDSSGAGAGAMVVNNTGTINAGADGYAINLQGGCKMSSIFNPARSMATF